MKELLNSILILILFCNLFSCTRESYIESEDLSNQINFSKVGSNKIDTIEFRIKTIFLYEPDKKRNGLILSPDNTNLTIEINIKNSNSKNIEIPLKYNKDIFSTRFYGCFDEKCFELIDFRLPMSLTIDNQNNINLSLNSLYFNFENLFEIKNDYTQDMLVLIEKICVKYYINNNFVIILPDKNTKIIKRNTYSRIKPRFYLK